MEERDQILIERYLAGELTAAEHLDVEQREKEDPLFRQALLDYSIARKALQLKQREELKQRFAKRDAELDKKKPEEPISVRHRFNWLWVAAAIVIALLVWKFLLFPDKVGLPSESSFNDSLKIELPPAVISDTLMFRDSGKVKEQLPPPRELKPDMAANAKKGGELFAAYFEPYKDAMMDPTTRGDEELSQLQKYQKAYWDGEYPKAVELFPQLTPDEQGNDNYRFTYANALLETGKTNQAISIFESIIKNNRSKYVAEAYFGLAMGQLRKENTVQANEWLTKYVKLEKARKKEQANEIIHKLKE